jgi:hypothetical protein
MNKFLTLVILFFGFIELRSQALVQFVHNSPDPSAASIDVYFNDVKYKDNLAFRQAGGFSSVAIMNNLIVKIADPTSTGPTDKIIATIDLGKVELGTGYVILANGVLGTGYKKGDNSYDINFGLKILNIGTPFQSDDKDKVEIFVGHGSTDAPFIDLYAKGINEALIKNLGYNQFSSKLVLNPDTYTLNLTPINSPNNVIASYSAPLSTAKGFKAFVFASGFYTPEDEPAGKTNKFGLFVVLPDGSIIELPANNGDAQVQVIHNCADPAGQIVDIYVNGQKPTDLDNLEFRKATKFLTLPAGVPTIVSINAPNSANPGDGVITTINLGSLEKDRKYYVVANGVVGKTFEQTEGRDINFKLNVSSPGLVSDVVSGVDLTVYHGVTDAPAVDVFAFAASNLENNVLNNEQRIVTNLDYSKFSNKINVPASAYGLTITVASNLNAKVNDYTANISSLDGQQAIILASGFLSPNNEGVEDAKGFELITVLKDGTVITLPVFTKQNNQFAKVQVIHNSSDPSAETVDVYVNDAKLDALNDFKFRTATPFVDLPANEDIIVKIASSNSENSTDKIIATINLGKLEGGKNYYVVANGVIGTKFEKTEGREIGFNLFVKSFIPNATKKNQISLNVFHGATDAPAVGVVANDHVNLINSVNYNEFTDFITVPTVDYLLHLTPGGASTPKIERFIAPLSSLDTILNTNEFTDALIFASGFLSPENEGLTLQQQEEYNFGLFAVVPNGGVIELTRLNGASFIQLFHASPDPLLESVDVYVNGGLASSDFQYLTATENGLFPFVNTPLTISINSANSTSFDDKVLKVFQNVVFEANKDYYIVANGVVSPGASNPFERNDITPTLTIIEKNLFSLNPEEFDFNAFHAVTDAPAVDIFVNDVIKAVDNLDFREISELNSLPKGDYKVSIRATGSNEDVIAYGLNIPESITGSTGLVVASGFLTPNDEGLASQEGKGFGVNVILNDGTVLPLSVFSSVKELVIDKNMINIFPNPTSDFIQINKNFEDELVNIELYDINGVKVLDLNQSIDKLDVNFLSNGLYFIKLNTNQKSYVSKFNVKK